MFPWGVNVQPISLQNHEPLRCKLLLGHAYHQLCFFTQCITRTARQIMLDHQQVNTSLSGVWNCVRIHRFAWSNRRMGLIVMTPRTRILKVIVGQQFRCVTLETSNTSNSHKRVRYNYIMVTSNIGIWLLLEVLTHQSLHQSGKNLVTKVDVQIPHDTFLFLCGDN